MLVRVGAVLRTFQVAFQRMSLVIFAAFAISMTTVTALAGLGVLSWISIDASWQGQPIQNAGVIVQISLTILFVSLCFFLPANARMLALETSHRRFAMDMQDVAQAYHAVHTADRDGVFQFSSEFDAMKERMTFMSKHQDLMDLEPPVLELAAQMSFMSKELADIYSVENVDRARLFLRQREQEVARFQDRLAHARAVSDELKHQLHAVKLEEQLASTQLDQLCEELMKTLPELDMEPTRDADIKLVELNAQRN